MKDITEFTATRIVGHIADRELSARDVCQAYLDRIEQFNPVINAVCTPNPRALDDAIDVDRRLAAGLAPRALEGVPFLVKDNLETKGLRTTFGSRLMQDYVPAEDSACVERMRQAGAVLLGKTNTPEFAHDVNTSNFLFGTTRNPWNLTVSAGGSSGGSGAAVAAGFAPLAIGTDFGGSVRIPASFNGIVGIRPAPGRVPVYPTDFGWDTLVPHVVGPMAGNVRDAALMLDVMAGQDSRDPMSLVEPGRSLANLADDALGLEGRRIAFCSDLGGLAKVDEEVSALARQAAFSFAALGCHVEEACFDASDLLDIIAGTRGFGMVARYAERYEQHKGLMTPVLKNQIEAALRLDLPTMLSAEKLRTLYWRRLATFMDKYDYIITPTCAAPPFSLGEPEPSDRPAPSRLHDVALLTYAFSVVGLPVVALPCGVTASGLPVGIQLAASRQREDLALQAAYGYEAVHPECFGRPAIKLP
ncbi:MAG: amidase [Alcaligenaceae bacterium]|nr:amidase [Alcaligenaceae bacterium]